MERRVWFGVSGGGAPRSDFEAYVSEGATIKQAYRIAIDESKRVRENPFGPLVTSLDVPPVSRVEAWLPGWRDPSVRVPPKIIASYGSFAAANADPDADFFAVLAAHAARYPKMPRGIAMT